MFRKGPNQRNAYIIYPVNNKIKESKTTCYPDNCKVNEYRASIPL